MTSNCKAPNDTYKINTNTNNFILHQIKNNKTLATSYFAMVNIGSSYHDFPLYGTLLIFIIPMLILVASTMSCHCKASNYTLLSPCWYWRHLPCFAIVSLTTILYHLLADFIIPMLILVASTMICHCKSPNYTLSSPCWYWWHLPWFAIVSLTTILYHLHVDIGGIYHDLPL